MGRQAKLKAHRREMRALRKADEQREKEERQKKQEEAQQNPPDLGVYAAENIDTSDKFGG